ncbi:MAG: FtsW/RodA/SpoVE family cell cycle protein [Eubacteriales bacterium]|nr:FtsW/RodA/SpoVE family cell cycle protein [Eubacteriales bacterium]
MDFLSSLFAGIVRQFSALNSTGIFSHGYTTAARALFVILASFILLHSILSLIKSKSPSEVWAYFHIENGQNIPVTHWENSIGRSKTCDLQIDDLSVSRNQGILTRNSRGEWTYMDLGSRNGAVINGKKVQKDETVRVETGDEILIGGALCTLFPVSMEEHIRNVRERTAGTHLMPPWVSLVLITIFQILTVFQLQIAMGDRYLPQITAAFFGMMVLMWVYTITLWAMKRRGFEIETIAFFLSTLSLAVVATCLPGQVFKQFAATAVGVVFFLLLCAVLRDLKRTLALKKIAYIGAAGLLIMNLIFASVKYGARNWIQIGGVSLQPSEIVKVAFIWVGAATMEELFNRKNNLLFTGFSIFCFLCLAKMGDFGTAIIFFATFLVISFMRSGDFTKLIAVLGVAFVGGLLVLRFRSYVMERFLVWGHVWENADKLGYQQTRTMSAAASGGLLGVGAGNGWLHNVAASQTDLVFGVVTEEWGLIIAVLAVLAIATLSIFAYRTILSGRSTYYTIAACATTALFLVQTILNVFGSVDILPLTGVTFPFLSYGGTSMVASWGLLAFLKAADTRRRASLAVSEKSQGFEEKPGPSDESGEEAAL